MEPTTARSAGSSLKESKDYVNMKAKERKIERFESLLHSKNIDIEALRKLTWTGIPYCQERGNLRATAWKILLGYLPLKENNQEPTLKRKRLEYKEMVKNIFDPSKEWLRSEYEKKNMKQINVDAPRTLPECPIFITETIQKLLVRILYVWCLRHPASGYVQGINDICAIFIIIFLKEYIMSLDENCFEYSKAELEEFARNEDALLALESDSYWCLCKIIDGIQDNFTEMRPGVFKSLNKMKIVVQKRDPLLLKHLQETELDLFHFAYRWVACFLMREFTLKQILKIWDAYIAEEADGFSNLHVYVCSSLLLKYSADIKEKKFQEALLFLQNLPTLSWSEEDLSMLLAEAYHLKSLYDESYGHMKEGAEENKE